MAKKMEFHFPGVSMQWTEDDFEAIWKEWEERTGRPASEMPSDEFADRAMKRLINSAVDKRQ